MMIFLLVTFSRIFVAETKLIKRFPGFPINSFVMLLAMIMRIAFSHEINLNIAGSFYVSFRCPLKLKMLSSLNLELATFKFLHEIASLCF